LKSKQGGKSKLCGQMEVENILAIKERNISRRRELFTKLPRPIRHSKTELLKGKIGL